MTFRPRLLGAAALAAALLTPSAFAALPAGTRVSELDADGFFHSGGTAYVAAYASYVTFEAGDPESQVPYGPAAARQFAARFECLRPAPGAACVYLRKGDLALAPVMSDSTLATLSSRKQVAEALADEARQMPELAAGGGLERGFADLVAALRRERNFPARYLAVLNRLSYETKDRETNPALHSGVAAWASGSGVCEAYARLALYAAAVSRLPARVETGDAFDEPSGRTGTHAWLRIGPYFLDPTFDDAATVSAGGARTDRAKSFADLRYFALSGDAALADRAPEGSPSKDLSPASTDARYWALAAGWAPGKPSSRLLEPYAKKRALGMGAADEVPTAAQLAAISANGAAVDLARDLTYACGASTCSAGGRKYLPLTENNRGYMFQKYSLDRIRSMSVVRLRDGTLAAFPPDGQGLE